MKPLSTIYITVILVVALSCARESSPSGGPSDEDPPVVVKSSPENGSVNFTGNSFEVVFDEFFVLNGLDQKLLISPPLGKRPEIRTRGKTLIVSIEEELRDSVTYTFYFQDAVQDLNENNPIDNFQFVFSTGPTLDSLSVTGTIYNSDNLEPGENIFVLLYRGSNDSLPLTAIPDYVTRAQPDGKYRIDYLVEGEYSIFGLKDVNNNKIYDLPDEGFAYLDSTIILKSSTNYIPPMPDTLTSAIDSAEYMRIPGGEYSLYIFTAREKRQYLKTSDREDGYKMIFSFALPVDSGAFEIGFPDHPEAKYKIEPSVKRDTFIVWLMDSLFFSEPIIPARLVYPYTDSTGVVVAFTDTIDMRYFAPRPVRGQAAVNDNKLSLRTNASERKGLTPGDNVKFYFSTPLAETDTTLLNLFLVSDTILIKHDYLLSNDSVIARKMFLDAEFVPDSTYLMIADKGVFKDIYGKQNDSMAFRFKVRNSESFGSLKVNLSGYGGNIILQLLTEDEKIIESQPIDLEGTESVNYPYLEAGSYRLKLVFDLDGNGEWTTGDYDSGRQPEPVTYYPEPINVKVLWTLEQDWVISSIRSKSDALRKPKVSTGRTSRTSSTNRTSTAR